MSTENIVPQGTALTSALADGARFRYLCELCKLDHGSKLIDLGTVMMASGGQEDLRKLVDEERGE